MQITANSKTLIDLAFTNKLELINGSGIILKLNEVAIPLG
jgi:hypothetical protein